MTPKPLDAAAAPALPRPSAFSKVIATTTHQPLAQAERDFRAQQAQRPTEARTVGDDTIASQQKVADVFTELGALKSHLGIKPSGAAS